MSEIDDELKDLFDKLDEDDEAPQPASRPVEFAEPEPALKPIPIEVQLDNLPAVNAPEAVVPNDISKKLKQLDEVTERILKSCEDDRSQAQEAIDLIKGEIERTLDAQNRPPAAFVEGLIKAIEVKAGINLTAVKIMEANAKMLAATKTGSSVTVNNNNSISSDNLADILSQPMTSMDEY